jgi:hypothetical protein
MRFSKHTAEGTLISPAKCPAHVVCAAPEREAFTLLEVMIALGIFFMAVFTILALVSNTLRNARGLQDTEVDPGMLAAQLTLTNRLYEGAESGDFGDIYPDYTWDQYSTPITNGLWQVDFTIHHRVGRTKVDNSMSILVYSPNSQVGMPGRR